jgi:hypothetical protein
MNVLVLANGFSLPEQDNETKVVLGGKEHEMGFMFVHSHGSQHLFDF